MFDRSHRRRNALTGEEVLVSPDRVLRPWQGSVEGTPPVQRPAHDPGCYLCPGNARAGGVRNPLYKGTFVFDNDFASLTPVESAFGAGAQHTLFQSRAESGVCRVVCFSPRHDLSLPELGSGEIEAVVRTWTEETHDLGRRPDVTWVQVFENKGEMMGCSNPHPHGQIWATEHLPMEPAKELEQQRTYFQAHGHPLLEDYLDEELRRQERIVCANDSFVALVPFWALWPFETLVLPRRPFRALLDLDDAARGRLADLLKRLTTRYDNLFEVSFPYSMGFHQAPADGEAHPEWWLHLHFFPPLLRGAAVRKFMVGFEMLGMPGRDFTPEKAAEVLRGLSEEHYTARV